MKHTVKRVISVLLAFVLTVGVGAGVPSVSAAEGGAVPSVYLVGGSAALVNAEGERVLPVTPPDGYLGEAVADCAPELAKALLLRTPETKAAYKEKLLSWVAPIYEKVVMDNNGDPVGEYYPLRDSDAAPFTIPEVMPDRISGGVYPLRAYDFHYDWRVDPIVNAAKLEDYINAILRGTGAQKVNLLGRCEGGTIVMAYLAEYGHEKVNKIFFNTTASNGYILSSAIFSGEMDFSAKEINAYFKNNPNVSLDSLDLSAVPAGEDLLLILKAFLDGSEALPILDPAGTLVDRLYADLIREVIPDVLLASYGTFPAVWAMIDNDHFDAALSYVFAGREAEYAGLIERIVYYHENVSLKTEELLKECEADGIAVGSVSKYGYPSFPLYAESELLSDGQALVKEVSFGATTSTHSGTLSEAYIASRDPKYISADKKIDASTCLFPDTSWFIGNLEHGNFPNLIDDLTQTFFLTDGMTVDTYPAYPQFTVYNEAYRLDPLTEENADKSVVGVGEEPTVSDASARFARAIANILIRVIVYVRTFIIGVILHGKGAA